MKDISQLSSIGLRTMVLYTITTLCAIVIGLGLANIIKPGSGISEATISELTSDATVATVVAKSMGKLGEPGHKE